MKVNTPQSPGHVPWLAVGSHMCPLRAYASPASSAAPQRVRVIALRKHWGRQLHTRHLDRTEQTYSGCEVLGVVGEADVSHGALREPEGFTAGLKRNGIEDVHTSISETSSQKATCKVHQKTIPPQPLFWEAPCLAHGEIRRPGYLRGRRTSTGCRPQ